MGKRIEFETIFNYWTIISREYVDNVKDYGELGLIMTQKIEGSYKNGMKDGVWINFTNRETNL